MDQAAYISVISYGCCSIEGGRQNLGNSEGEGMTRRREWELSLTLHRMWSGLLHYSTMHFQCSRPLPPSPCSLWAAIGSRVHCLAAFCPVTAHLSLPLPPLSHSLSPFSSTFSPVRMTSPNLMNQRSSHSGWWLLRETPHEWAYWTRRCRV